MIALAQHKVKLYFLKHLHQEMGNEDSDSTKILRRFWDYKKVKKQVISFKFQVLGNKIYAMYALWPLIHLYNQILN